MVEGKKESLSYYCRLSMALSLNTFGRSLSQSRDTLMAGRGHSPMISSRFLLSKARLSIAPRKDTRKRQLHYNIAQTRATCFIWRIYHHILQILQNENIIFFNSLKSVLRLQLEIVLSKLKWSILVILKQVNVILGYFAQCFTLLHFTEGK